MKKALLISATASNQGKTLLTMALLSHYRKRVRAFKVGPDFIDPQFHERISHRPSVNLDGFMMDEKQLQWLFSTYADADVAILEGVMGFYDGMDKESSAYDISKMLHIPTLLLLDASGSYITIAALLKGLMEFQDENTIKAVVLNRITSKMHYELVKKQIELYCKGIVVAGWIPKDMPSLKATHLGLDLRELEEDKVERISKELLEHIDLKALEEVMEVQMPSIDAYPFKTVEKRAQKCVLVKDNNFSFVYHDNLEYLKELYRELVLIDATKDESIPIDADIVIIPGGYVETEDAYEKIKAARNFKSSLIEHAKSKAIYAECAGLIYLGENIDDKSMSGILPISFALGDKRERLGYYLAHDPQTGVLQKGHAFHYSHVTKAPKGDISLYKSSPNMAKDGGWIQDKVKGSYLHRMWRVDGL